MSAQSFALAKELRDPAAREERLARIEQLEDEVLESAAEVIEGALSFRDITHDQEEPPPEWIEQFGRKGAERRLRVAKATWLPASHAPIGLTLASRLYTGIVKGKAARQQITQNNLNVSIGLPAPTSAEHPGPIVYETRELEE